MHGIKEGGSGDDARADLAELSAGYHQSAFLQKRHPNGYCVFLADDMVIFQ